MTLIQRLVSFVPPTLLFVIPVFSQLQGKLEQLPGNIYRVSVVPAVTWAPPQSATNNAQITLRASSGKLGITDFQSLTGFWNGAAPVQSPTEAQNFDYFSFSLSFPLTNVTWQQGQAVPLFSFKNAGGCTLIEIIDNQNDPFLPPNSMSVNIGNSFSVVGAGIGQNAYTGNTAESSVNCPPLDIHVFAQNNPVPCNGDKTAIMVQAFGGSEPYDITWQNLSNGNSGSTQITAFEGGTDFQNMPPGDYFFTIKDSRDSTRQDSLTITQPPKLKIELKSFDASCNGSLDGVVFVDKTYGGTVSGSYQYYWDTNPGVSSVSAGFLNPGSYTVTVQDDNGCTAEGSVEVKTFALIFPNVHLSKIKCNNDNNGVIDIYPVGVNPPFTYQWTSNVTTGNFSSAWHLGPGTYTVTVTDATGVCYETATVTLDEPPAIEADYLLLEPECYGDKGYLGILEVDNASGSWESQIVGLTDFSDKRQYEIEPGYQQKLVIKDAKGCKLTEEFLIPAKPQMTLEIGDNHFIKYGEEIHFQPLAFPLNNIRYEWFPAEGLSCTDCPDPVAKPTENITYHLRITDTLGCELYDKVSVQVRKSRDIYIPNAFSPNYDGINDIFCPYAGFEVTSIKTMQVFDRWGGLIYETKEAHVPGDPVCGWDGMARGKPADTGMYLYTINVEFIDGETVLFAGDVQLMR